MADIDISKQLGELSDVIEKINEVRDKLAEETADAFKTFGDFVGIASGVGEMLNPLGLKVMLAGAVATGLGWAFKQYENKMNKDLNELLGSITLSTAKQQLFTDSYFNNLNMGLSEARIAFAKLSQPPKGKEFDAFDVEMKMMEIAMRDNVLSADQLGSMYDTIERHTAAALDNLELDYLRSQAEIELGGYSKEQQDNG